MHCTFPKQTNTNTGKNKSNIPTGPQLHQSPETCPVKLKLAHVWDRDTDRLFSDKFDFWSAACKQHCDDPRSLTSPNNQNHHRLVLAGWGHGGFLCLSSDWPGWSLPWPWPSYQPACWLTVYGEVAAQRPLTFLNFGTTPTSHWRTSTEQLHAPELTLGTAETRILDWTTLTLRMKFNRWTLTEVQSWLWRFYSQFYNVSYHSLRFVSELQLWG